MIRTRHLAAAIAVALVVPSTALAAKASRASGHYKLTGSFTSPAKALDADIIVELRSHAGEAANGDAALTATSTGNDPKLVWSGSATLDRLVLTVVPAGDFLGVTGN